MLDMIILKLIRLLVYFNKSDSKMLKILNLQLIFLCTFNCEHLL